MNMILNDATRAKNDHFLEDPSHTPRAVLLFFVIAFAITWIIWIPALAYAPANQQIVFIILAAFGPFLAAVITIWTTAGLKGVRAWARRVFKLRIPFSLYLAGAFFLPVGIGVLHYVLYRILEGAPNFAGAEPWYLYLVYLIPTALLSGGNEEPGWRGFALPALLQHLHPIAATLILGFFHAAWHLPLMNYYDTTFGWYLFNLIPLTILLNWFYLISRGSVFPVMLLHAGTNVIMAFIPAPADVLGGLGTFMVLRGTVYWAIALVLLIATKGTLGWRSSFDDSNNLAGVKKWKAA